MTRRSRGWIIAIVAVVVVVGFAVVSLVRSKGLDAALDRVVDEARASYADFDPATSARASIPVGSEVAEPAFPELDGAVLYRATFGEGNTSVDAVYVVRGPLGSEGCVTVHAVQGDGASITRGACDFV